MTTERSGMSLEMTIVEAIIDNLCGRYGFDTAFDVDDDILKAIKQEMADTIEDRLARAFSPPGICLPVLIHGKAYDVPIGVQLHIVALEEKLAALSSFATRHATVPDGYVLVPAQMHISKQALEGIHYTCGGDDEAIETEDRWCEGIAWVGDVIQDDNSKLHGLHIMSAEYPEEGSITLAEFPNMLAQWDGGKE